MLNLPEVLWSNHAIARGEERFGDCTQLTFPDELIQVVACCKQVGETFKVAQAKVVYVCVKATENHVLVKTVHSASTEFMAGGSRANGRLATDPHNRSIRGKLDSRERRSRASYKRELEQLYIPCSNYNEDREMDSPADIG